jgi:conjugal transfer pilus assembly protein TraI
MAHAVPDGTNFPTADPGFAALPVADLLASAKDLIARIRLCFGIDRDSFDSEVQPLLHQYAAYVHLLPATADNYFSTPGGLLRLGLEVAFFSLQGTDAHIFAGRSTISSRRQLEPRWRQATFIGGLCCELHRALSHVIVTDAAGEQWPAYLQPLSAWLADRGADRYFVRWRPNAVEARGLGFFALPLVVPAGRLQYLNEDNAVIVPHLLASVGGVPVYREHNVLDSLVRRSLALVIDRNLQANADRYGSPQFGSHLERYLVDALRRLAASSSSWVPNRDKSRVWLGPDGLYLVWPQGVGDVQALLDADQLPGIPKAPETVLDVLLAAGVFQRTDEGHAVWTILPPDVKAPLEAVKLSSAAILFTGVDAAPTPLATRLVRKPGETSPVRPKEQPAPVVAPGTQYSLIEPATPAAVPGGIADMPDSDSSTVGAPSSPDTALPVSAAPLQAPPPPRPDFRLKAPLRLNPAVRDALTAIVYTLNGPGSAAAACAVADGLFVPLHELEQRGIQPALAARALAEVRLLVHKDHKRPPTVSREFAGAPTVGLVICPSCVEGFDPAAFTVTEPEEH